MTENCDFGAIKIISSKDFQRSKMIFRNADEAVDYANRFTAAKQARKSVLADWAKVSRCIRNGSLLKIDASGPQSHISVTFDSDIRVQDHPYLLEDPSTSGLERGRVELVESVAGFPPSEFPSLLPELISLEMFEQRFVLFTKATLLPSSKRVWLVGLNASQSAQ